MGKQKKELTWQERMRLIDSSYQANYGTDTTQKTADSLKVSNTALKPTVEYDENIVPLDIETELTGEKTPTKRVQQYTQPTVPTPVNPMFMQLLQEEQKKQQLYQQTENQKQLQQLIDGIEGGKKNEGVVINRRPVYDLIPENRSGQEFITPTGEWQPTLEYQPREIQIGKLKGLQQKHDSGQPLTEEEDKMLKRLSVIQERKTLGNENRITDTAGSLTLQNIEPLISQFSGMHPATATVQGGGQLLRNIFNMDKQYNDGDAVRQGIDIALNTVGMGIQMIPKVAVISAIANNLKLFTGATGKTTGAWGIKDQKNIDVLTHYATMIPFGARVTTALIMSEQGAEGLKSALDKNMIPGLEGIREDDKMRIVEGASHALFFASLYGAGKIGGGIKNKIDNAVKTTLEKDFPRVFDQISTGNKNIQMTADDMRTFGSDLIPPKETTEGRRFDKFDKKYEESGYRNIDEYLAKHSPAERQQFMESWGKYKEKGNVDFFDFVDMYEGRKTFKEIEPQNKVMRVPQETPPETQSMLKKIQDKKLTPKQLEVVQDYLLRKGVPQDLIDQARGQITEKPKEQPKQVQTKEQVKNDNVLQLEIMQKAGIPEAEMPDYALSSVADGKLLRSYITEVKNGELTVDEAVERVKTDYEKMKTGEKEGKFIEPEQPQTVEPKNVALSTPNQAIKEIEQTGGKVVKVYHGGSGVQSLRNKFSILTPEQKQSLPSSHVGLTGLSMTTNPDIARRYSQYIGGTSEIFEATINPNAKILTIDTKGEGIDGVYSDNEINDIANKGYDAIQDISNGAESEFRALTSNAILDKEIKFAKHPDGTLKNKNEYTQEEWKAYTTSVINKKLSETPKPKQERPKETPKQKEAWEMTRDEFIQEKELKQTESNKLDTPTENIYKVGDRYIEFGNDPYVFELRNVNPNDIDYSEKWQSEEAVLGRDDVQQYIKWFKEGKQPMPISVVFNKDRKEYISSNRRRLLAARNSGVKTIPAWVEVGKHRDLIQQALSEGKPVPEEVLADYPELRPKEEVKPEGIITDPVEKQKKIESINEGMLILKHGKKINGKPYAPEELEMVRRAVINAKKKIGDTSETPEVVYPKPKDTPKTESKPETINPRIKADDLEKLLSQKQKEMSPKEFFDYLDNLREKLVLTEQRKNDFPTVKRREVLRKFTQEATRQNPTEKDKIRKIADVAIANFIEQPGFSVVEFMTASARAVATKRLEQAGYKTTKMVEGEKTKFALKIEKPKQEATQTKPKEPELTEEQEDKILRKTEFADIINVPIKDIHIDLKRFQNRKSAYAEAIVKDIVDNFKPWSFKQITLWKDPKDGKDYVISGHSRLEGIIKRGDVDKIPSQYFPGTEAEARLYGKLEGNRENQNESLIEDVSAYKIAKESQLPKAELLRAFKTEGKINKLERLSYLDEKGEFLNNLDSEAAQSFPNIERNAGWVGELRKEYPVLTLAHENEIFDFFYRGKKENTLIRKEDFIDLVEKRISDGAFKSDQALLLDKVDNTGARGRADTREAQRQIDKLIENNKHYEALMKNADEAERDEYQAKLLRNLREIDRLKGGVDKALNSQMSLFQTSSQIFTRNFKNWFGDWENDPKNASRVVDAEGKPQVMYHGTNRTFDSFRDDRILYFSDNPEYAAMYGAGSAAKGAHYVGGKEKELENKTQAGANIYPVYIKATNIFDTTNPKHKAIFDREYYGKYGNKTPLDPEKQLPDWTDAEDLKEFFDDKGYNFDGIKLAESHGNTTIAVFSPSQIKSATGNKGTFSEFNNSILAQETKDLAALHNLTEDNLLHADKMGGLAMPSLAITRNELGLGKYGEITLIGDKDMVDPESGVKVFNRDAYSPTYPVIYRQVNRKALDKKISGIVENLPKELSKDLSNTGDRLIQDLSTGKYTAKDMQHNKLLRVHFLDSIGELPEPLMRNERLQHLPEFEGHYEAAQKLLSKYPQLKTPKEPTEEEISTESEKLLAKNKEYIERQRDPENALRSWAKSLIKEKNQEGYDSEVKGFVKDYLNEFYKSLDKDIREGLKESFDSIANYHPGNLQNDLRRLLDPKKELNSYDYHYELVDPLIKKKQKEYEAFLEKEFGDVFGEEYLLKGSKKVPHSLSNVIDIMGTKIKGSEKTLVQGLGKSAAQSAKQFKSIEDMRKNKGRIVAENEFKEAEERLNNAFMELSDKVGRYYPTYGEFDFGRLDKLSLAIGKLSKGRQTDADVRRELSRAGYRGVPSIYYDNVKEVARMMKEMPTEYFEAKLERPVRLSEFNTAIVPETISPQAIKVLEDNGVKVVKYTDDADRKIKTRQAAERNKALFQSGDNPSGKPFSQLPKAEQEKLTKIITDRVIGLVIPDRTVKANVNAITELVSEVVRFHPDRADEGTMWHEGTHLGLKSSTRPSEAKAILLQMRDSQGKRLWDGKGDPFDVANNPSLKEAHEQFAEDFETFLNDKKAFDEKYKTNPLRKRVAEVFERIKEIYRKIVNALKGEGFADAANWYRRFYEGSLKKEAEKRFREEDIKTEKDLVLAEKQQLFQITGEKGMQNYDKANNTHIVRNNLSVAKQMDKQKLTPEQIRLATGWEKGVDGLWRYEVPDGNFKNIKYSLSEIPNDESKLSDIWDDDKLFEAYPQLKEITVKVNNNSGYGGSYIKETNTIEINLLRSVGKEGQKSTLIHEIQHAIQNIEGFAFGGTPEMFKKQWRKENDLVEGLNKQLSAASKSGDKKLYNELLDERAKVVKRIKELEDEYGIVGYKQYKRLAGEVEARNVQTRLNLTPEEKKAKTLQSTEDVPREDQIIRDSYGEASMASEPDPIGLNKAEIKELREELELDKLPKPERKRMENSLNEAKLRGLKDTAMITADEVIRTKRVIDEAEHAGMVMKAKDLRDEINDIQRQVGAAVDAGDSIGIRKLIARRDDLIEQMDKLTMASDIAGTGIARALSIRRLRVEGANYDFASVMQRAKTQKGERLTEKETARLTELTTKYEQAEQQLKTLQSEYEKMLEENEKLKAQKVTEAEVRKTSVERRASVQREKIVKEREDIKAQLRGLGFRVNDVAGLSAEGTYLIGKLALNYIKEGVVDLNEVVQKVMADVPDITERDVWRGINSKDPTRQVKAERETTKKVNQIKTQARLLEKIRLAEEGIFDKPRSKPQQDVEIKRLKDTLTSLRKEAFKSELEAKKLERALQTINELQDQLANMRRSIRKKQPEPTADLKAAKEKIKELRKIMRMDDQLADLNEQLRTKEFKIKEPRPTTPTTPEIDRKAVEIYTLKKKINEEVRKLRPLTIADYGMEVMNTLRTAKASMDMSAALRQAFFPSARRPLLAMQVQAKAIEAFFSQNAYDEIQYNIENHPNHYIRQMAKLEMTDIHSSPSHREEMFASTFAEKIPIYKHGILASNRHMVATLNLIRAGVFDEFLETYPNATMNELKAWADYVNVATGRGNLGKFTAAAQNLSYVLFSPRFAISRLQLPFMILKHWNEPRVRKEMAKDYAHFGGMAMTILGLAALAGLQVGTDPEDPNFGKIIVGNTKVDIFAGIQQPTRLLLRIGKTGTNRLGWTEASKREENPLEMIYRFGSYKLAPSVTVPVELMRGKSIIGEEREPTETLVNAVIPMVYEDIGDAYKDGGISKAAWSGSLNFFGMSTNTYEKKDATTVKTKGFEPRGRMYDRRGRTSVKRDYR